MAEGMAKVATEEAAKAAGELVVPKIEPEPASVDVEEPSQPDSKAFAVPKQVILSHEEARTLFKVCVSSSLAPISVSLI